jgi:hypothetical protein
MIITINKSVVYQNIEDEKVVLNLETNKYHSLNHFGLIIWDLIDKNQPVDFERLIEFIKIKYTIKNNLTNDIKEYIAELQSHDLVIIEDEKKI